MKYIMAQSRLAGRALARAVDAARAWNEALAPDGKSRQEHTNYPSLCPLLPK
jgi:hypothetical protein